MRNGMLSQSYSRLIDRLDMQVRKVAWRHAKRHPNGELDGATFFWPGDVKQAFERIERITAMLRCYECRCTRAQKKQAERCPETLEVAQTVLLAFGVGKALRRRIALTVAQLAHVHPSEPPLFDDPE